MIINHNMASLNTYNKLSTNTANTAKSLEKLSSGLRINKAGDDAAGLAISEKMRGQIRGLDQASRNSQDAISMIQTAEGSLSETQSILQRMRELATQAASDTNVTQDRSEMQKELNQLTSEINRIGNTTEFNTQKLLNGGTGKTAQIRYSVATTGAAEATPTGDVSAISVLTNSVKASTATVSAITVSTSSVAAAGSAVGALSQPNETQASIVAGTGSIQLFREDTASVKAADAGTLGSPFLVDTPSVANGTGAMNIDEIVAGGAGATATYGIELTANFTDGDTIDIGTATWTAVDGVAGANEFTIGASITETRDNILTAIDAGGSTYVDGGVTYNLTKADPTWTASNDNNLIVFTNAAGNAVDANAVPMNASAVTQVAAQAGIYKFEVATNYEVGQKVTVAGQEFTAVAANGGADNDATHFEVDADVETTSDNLKAALDAAKVGGAYGNYNITLGADGTIYEDTITFTEVAASGTDMIAPTTTNIVAQAGAYSFEIKDNFSIGDKITIDGQELTAVAANGGADNTATTFEVGASKADTASNLKLAIVANGTLNASYDSAVVAGAFGNNRITLTEKAGQEDGVALADPTAGVSKVAEQVGISTFSLVANFDEGEKITIGGQEFTAANGTTGSNSATTFKVGLTTDATAANLKLAIEANSTLDDHYTVGLVGSDFTLTEKATQASASLPTISATSAVGEVRGDYKFDITSNVSAGDKITIAGQEFTAKASGATAASGEFNVGDIIGDTVDSLLSAINATAGTNVRFDATKLTDDSDPLNPSYSIRLIEENGQATGVNVSTPSLSLVQEARGVSTFQVTDNFASKDKLVIAGVTLTAGSANSATTFAVGADASATAVNISAAINLNTTLNTTFVAASAGDTISLTEKAGLAAGTDLDDPDVKGDSTAGVFNFAMNALGAGAKVNVDGTELTLTTGGTEIETAAQLKSLIDNNSTLNAKYSVAVSNENVTLTQKTDEESAVSPILSFETKAGSGFVSQLQIGANTGQSMVLEVEDMRSMALGVSDDASTTGQTVEVGGKQYGVAWTATTTVTSGSDNIANEFALDISTHDNATAAVKIIDTAINAVSSERAKMGAYQNRLEHTIANLGTSSENMTGAESRIRDVDMAKEMMQFQKNNILAQAATAMLAQANQQPQGVLQLLR